MSKFLKIPISPLMGSSILNYIKVIQSNTVDFKFYLHVFLTFLVVLLISPFQLIDKIIFFLKEIIKIKEILFLFLGTGEVVPHYYIIY